MEGKDSDTDEEFNDVLSENEISEKVSEPEYDPPEYDPNPYMGNVILSPAPAPAPQGDVVDAEFLEDSEEIKKLNKRIDRLEEKIRICCPEKEEKPKIDVKYDYKTRGWIIIRGGSAYSGKIGPLSGPRKFPPRNSGRNEVIESMGLVGYSERNGVNRDTTTWWPRDQTHDPDEMLKNTIKESHTDTHIASGVSLHLIKKKIDEGFVIEFEDPLDASEMTTAPAPAPAPEVESAPAPEPAPEKKPKLSRTRVKLTDKQKADLKEFMDKKKKDGMSPSEMKNVRMKMMSRMRKGVDVYEAGQSILREARRKSGFKKRKNSKKKKKSRRSSKRKKSKKNKSKRKKSRRRK
jgi:hypothetical protein